MGCGCKRIFTQEEIKEIRDRIALLGIKDTQFPNAEPLQGNEVLAIVQNGENKLVTLTALAEYILGYGGEETPIYIKDFRVTELTLSSPRIVNKSTLMYVTVDNQGTTPSTVLYVYDGQTLVEEIEVSLEPQKSRRYTITYTPKTSGVHTFKIVDSQGSVLYQKGFAIDEDSIPDVEPTDEGTVYLGVSYSYNDIYQDKYKHDIAGSVTGEYTVLSEPDGGYMYLLCPVDLSFNKILMMPLAYPVPMKLERTVSFGGDDTVYNVWKSEEDYNEKTYNITIE